VPIDRKNGGQAYRSFPAVITKKGRKQQTFVDLASSRAVGAVKKGGQSWRGVSVLHEVRGDVSHSDRSRRNLLFNHVTDVTCQNIRMVES